MKDIKRLDLSDSIIVSQKLQILNFKYILVNCSDEKAVLTTQISNRDKDLHKKDLQLKISKTINKFWMPAAFGVGIIVGSLLK